MIELWDSLAPAEGPGTGHGLSIGDAGQFSKGAVTPPVDERHPVGRYVVDALVLPIFKGVKPILELKIIARQLLAGGYGAAKGGVS